MPRCSAPSSSGTLSVVRQPLVILSSFTVALLNALHTYKREFVSSRQLAEEACDIEIARLGEPIVKVHLEERQRPRRRRSPAAGDHHGGHRPGRCRGW